MQIKIDTKEDSHEDIRKIIRMLSSLVGDREVFTNKQPANIFDSSSSDLSVDSSSESSPDISPEPTNAFASMFGSDSGNVFSDESKDEDDEIKVEESEDVPDVIEYH